MPDLLNIYLVIARCSFGSLGFDSIGLRDGKCQYEGSHRSGVDQSSDDILRQSPEKERR